MPPVAGNHKNISIIPNVQTPTLMMPLIVKKARFTFDRSCGCTKRMLNNKQRISCSPTPTKIQRPKRRRGQPQQN